MSVFEIRENSFYLDGEIFNLLSGAVHYFRTVPEYWEDRLLKLKACGLNTVETYIPWNLHEKSEGKFNFSGIADVESFINLAGSLELKVIIRPSPFICGEWEFGGLPAWLLSDSNMKLRCACPLYLKKIENYYNELIPRISALQCTKGGPVILVQIENEYGSYGNDKKYLSFLENNMRQNGIEVPLFTSDGACDMMLSGGTLPYVFKTVNFGSGAKGAFENLRAIQPEAPLM
ncbi:MAG: beta-galactosidase, partial [Oscillospiraceae bacterium]